MTAVEARRPGRPRGSRNRPRPTLPALLRELAAREGPALLAVLVSAAKAGDAGAAGTLLQAVQWAGEAPR